MDVNKYRLLNEAKLSVIAVRTRDTINFKDVLTELTGEAPIEIKPGAKFVIDNAGMYYMIIPRGTHQSQMPDLDGLYNELLHKNAALFVVNPPTVMDVMFDGGELPTPRHMVLQLMTTILEDAKKAEAMMPALGGLTLKEVHEYAKVTMVRDHSLTPQGMVQTRKEFFQGQQGLTLVDPHQDFYQPDPKLTKYLQEEKPFFLNPKTDFRLIPRGLLFDGPPGVGKTAGAKYIAEQWGVPLYRFDVATTQNKFVGESEANMAANMSRLDNEEPCVALFDEVEKIFSNTSFDGGFKKTLMSQLLWWLAERRSRVLVIMTTNNSTVIPPELFRERRIDHKLDFKGLTGKHAEDFCGAVFKTFKITDVGLDVLKKVVATAATTAKADVSQSALTQAVFKHVKASKIAQGA